ncbi:methyl-accepting chemotaxis protein [Paenibacillus hamazuiensis]|uniref:methyl-accepting chemotaxis protein n=1 Tax=Paenibacillus hamazuiensis TaxID=2936508 RepID=UPI0020109ADE|nr:methyl-accepting chemotaxis protein [Paenibacillus hamazuiensis]
MFSKIKRAGDLLKKNPVKSVGMKLFLIIFVSIVVLVAVMGGASYSISKNVLQNKVADASLQTIVQTGKKLDILFNSYENLVNQAMADTNLKILLFKFNSSAEGSFERKEIQKQLVLQLSNFSSNNAMYAISLIDKNGKSVATTGQQPKNEVAVEDWFKKISSVKDGKPVWLETRNNGFFGSQGLKSFALGQLIPESAGGSNDVILLFEFKFSVLQAEMDDVKMSETGFTHILNSDHKIIYDKDETFLEAVAESDVTLGMNQYSGVSADQDGRSQLTVYYKSAKTGWYVLGTVPMEELLAETNKIFNVTIIITIIAVLLACGLGYLVVRVIARPLVDLRNLIKEGESGKLSVRCGAKSRDEIGQLAQSFNQMMEQIGILVQHINNTATEVLTTSGELSAASKKTAFSAKEIATATEEIAVGASGLAAEAEKGNEIAQSIGGQMENVMTVTQEMEQSASQVQEASRRGTVYMTELIKKTNSTAEMTRAMTEKVTKLNDSTQSIRQILDLLNNLVNQTNILSLNAAIEAARAGAAGKSFMVVADEIRKLADQSKQSIDIVGQITESITNEIDETVSVLSNAYPVFQEQFSSVNEADQLFKHVQDQMNGFIEKLWEVSESVRHLDSSQNMLGEAMSTVSAVAQQSSATSQEVASLSNEQMSISEGLIQLSERLEQLSHALSKSLAKFQV